MMQKISPFLWFDNQAEEAARFYTSLFPDSRVKKTVIYDDLGPELGETVTVVEFQLAGLDVTAMNAGPAFSFTPAISFMVACESEDEIDRLFEKLSEDGSVLMPLQAYPFSEKFAWVNDRYGLSWQLSLADATPKITPFLLFVGEQSGKAEEAIRFYTSLFPNSGIETIVPYGPGGGEPEGSVMHGQFSLHGQPFMAMDSALQHDFTFTEAISLYVDCETQEEVDRLWDSLTADGGEPSQCGWLKDRYGVSWQIIPRILIEMQQDEDPEKARRVNEAMLKMTKIEIDELQRAYAGPQPAGYRGMVI
jgi:predicted 3-demethylubiquinone-9 3-methyltransferase (glyoxalase superfamily)